MQNDVENTFCEVSSHIAVDASKASSSASLGRAGNSDVLTPDIDGISTERDPLSPGHLQRAKRGGGEACL